MYVPIVANSKYAIHQQTDTVIFTLTPTSSSDNLFLSKIGNTTHSSCSCICRCSSSYIKWPAYIAGGAAAAAAGLDVKDELDE